MPQERLDEILDLLNRHQQRATYGAVGAIIGRPAAFLMGGRPRNHRHSWIVNQETGLPTGYAETEMHPALRTHEQVLVTSEKLESWLTAARAEPTSH